VASITSGLSSQGLITATAADESGVTDTGTLYVLTSKTTTSQVVMAIKGTDGKIVTATQGTKGSPKIK
jgi:hypothetical protein